MPPLLLDGGLHQLSLIPVHIVLGENLLNGFEPSLDHLAVIGGTMLPQQVFKHVGRDDRVLLQSVRQVLSYHQTWKVQEDLLIQGT